MPLNLKKAQGAINDYRVVHTTLHNMNPPGSDTPSWQLSNLHDPLTIAMRTEMAKWGFAHEDEVFVYSDNEVLSGMGYSNRLDFFNAVYDANGDVISGKESDHNTWEARFK